MSIKNRTLLRSTGFNSQIELIIAPVIVVQNYLKKRKLMDEIDEPKVKIQFQWALINLQWISSEFISMNSFTFLCHFSQWKFIQRFIIQLFIARGLFKYVQIINHNLTTFLFSEKCFIIYWSFFYHLHLLKIKPFNSFAVFPKSGLWFLAF